MRVIDVIIMGVSNLLRRKVRTLLTVIGVVVGTTAIVVMVSLALGMRESMEQSIANMGDLTVIELNQYSYIKDDQGNYQDRQNTLNEDLITKIKAMDGVLAVTPYLQGGQYGFKIKAGSRFENQYAQIIGVYPEALPYLNIQLKDGTLPDADDKDFLLFGQDAVINFRDPNKPIRDWYKEFYNADGTPKPPKVDVLTSKIVLMSQVENFIYDSQGNQIPNPDAKRLKKHYISKVGIMEPDDRNFRTQYAIFAHIDVVREMILEMEKIKKVKADKSVAYTYDTIIVKVADIKAAELVQDQIKEMGISVNSLSDIRKEMQKQQSAVQVILAGIGAMSLFVAAIGIANTMVMSIYERTREIGVMKVLGCPLNNIRQLFLFEAAMIGFFGGLMGIALSYGVSFLMNSVPALSTALGGVEGSKLSVIPPWLIGVAIIFATFIGLISGYFPARKATRISALEAIKNDG